jgi:hypothetical protein
MLLEAIYTSGTEQDTVYLAGSDALLVASTKITQNVLVSYQLLGSAATLWSPWAQTAIPVFLPDANYAVVGAWCRPEVVGSTTVNLVHAIASTPLGSSVNIMQSTFNMSGAVDVNQTGIIVTGSTITNIAPGDVLGLRANTPGAASGQAVFTIVLQRI